MKKVTSILILFSVSLFVISCGENTEADKPKAVTKNVDVVPEEVDKEEQLNDNLTKISDPEKVAELRQKLLEEEAFKKELELEDLQSRSLAERYKLGDTSIV